VTRRTDCSSTFPLDDEFSTGPVFISDTSRIRALTKRAFGLERD
jgi:hypothetical protein